MDYEELTGYNNDTLDVNIDDYFNDGKSLLDEIPDSARFVPLDEFLKRGDDNYEKWGLE